MRFRKANVILGIALIVGIFLLFFLIIDTSPRGLYWDDDAKKAELKYLEDKLKSLENDFVQNKEIVKNIKDTVKDILSAQTSKQKSVETKSQPGGGTGFKISVNKTMATIDKKDTKFALTAPSKCDIEMDKVYDALKFDNPDGGVWKQGWDIQYKESQWTEQKKLRVFVVPHSHNDPGWIKTFEKYYTDQTRHILDTVVAKLQQHKEMRFIWAEISYLSLWWAEQSAATRQAVLHLLEEGRLEIVTGGYVMPDEANSHYSALLEQLQYGHEWCSLNLNGYKPNSGWSIDPFGMSPTTAYLLKRAGFDNMLIQRTHYSVKKELAKQQALEFKWRQHWDHSDTSDMLCHMMPFYSYDIPHTCGPDPKICCQFDFLRLPGGRATCPWGASPRSITPANVAERARLLLDQYKKKAQLYKTDVLFVPLGDDFRWDSAKEWDNQQSNYQAIMDYINSQAGLHAEVRWGTLSDYFTAVRGESEARTKDETGLFPTLSGDFFTYADRDDHYWSGYFTTRPFWKRLDRVLGGYLRSGEILFSLAWAQMEYVGSDKSDMAARCMAGLTQARKALGLFQHHDGITGTAKDHVVLDYGDKMVSAIREVQEVISQSAAYLLSKSKSQYKPDLHTKYFDLDDTRDSAWSVGTRTTIQIEHSEVPARLVVGNTHARRRQELLTVRVSRPDIMLYRMVKLEDMEEEEEPLPCQLSPVFRAGTAEISNTEFELTFLAEAAALGLNTYYIRQLRPEDGTNTDLTVAAVKLFNTNTEPFQVDPFSSVRVLGSGEEFSLGGTHLTAKFSAAGLLQSITTREDGVTTPAVLQFWEYGTRSRGDKSGAYLFLPDGAGRARDMRRPLVRVVEGALRSCVTVEASWVRHSACLHNSPGTDGAAIAIQNDMDLTNENMNNKEISMRVSSDLQSGDTFYTDLNGFQMIKRKRYKKLPLQANFYPLPSLAYVQDSRSRLSLVSGQPLGGSSPGQGQLEIMQDRRLMQDDNRGLFQGIQDNKVSPHRFLLLLERQAGAGQGGPGEESQSAASYPSLLAHAARHSLLSPLLRLIWLQDHAAGHALRHTFSPVQTELPCDIHVVNLRTMLTAAAKPSDQAALVLHRQGFTAAYRPVGMTCSTNGGKLSMDGLFPELYSSSVKQMALSLMYDGMKMEKSFTVSIQPMELYSFLLTR